MVKLHKKNPRFLIISANGIKYAKNNINLVFLSLKSAQFNFNVI